MEHEHGEPWALVHTRKLGSGFTASYVTCNEQDVATFHHEDYAARAVLCVNACAGMSDEEVGEAKEYRDMYFRMITMYDELVTNNKDLKAQLLDKHGGSI